MNDLLLNPVSDPESRWRQQLAVAEALQARGLVARAEAAYRALIKLDEKRLEGYVGVSQCARSREDVATSLLIFDEAAIVYPAHAGVQMERAADLAALGRLDEAEAAYLAVLEAGEHAPARRSLITCARQRGDSRAVLAHFQAAVAAAPRDPALRTGLVEALVAQGSLPEALGYIRALEPEFSEIPEILARRLNLMRETGDLRGALELGRKLNAQLPEHFWIWLERCNAELTLGTDADVAGCLAAAPAKTAGEAATVRRLTGSFAARRWQLDDALAHYEAAAALNPDDPLIQKDLTRSRILLFDLEDAAASLRRFCELDAPHASKVNIAQTHYGQIIHEASFDRDTLAEFKALLYLPPAARWSALFGAVRDNPGNTAVAISLMIALRQGGAFAAAPLAAADVQLPRHIFQFWPAGIPPDEVAAAIQSWRDKNPDYSFSIYNDISAQQFITDRFPPEVLLAYRRVREPSQKVDIFRLAYLAAAGGIYADVHDRCIASLGEIVPDNAALVLYQEELGTIGTSFIAASPAHPVVLTALRMAVIAINRGDRDIGWLATGPALLTRALAQFLAARDSATLPAGVVLLERRALFTTVALHCAANYLRAVPSNK